MNCHFRYAKKVSVTATCTSQPSGAGGLWHADSRWVMSLTEYMGHTLIPASDRFKLARSSHDRQDVQEYLLNKYGRRIINRKLIEETQVEQAKPQIRTDGKAVTNERITARLALPL